MVAAELAKPISQELLDSSIPARLAYIGTDGDPRVIPVGFLWKGPTIGVATVPMSWEAGVRALFQQMTVITIVPDWAKLLDFETTIPKAVADLMADLQNVPR